MAAITLGNPILRDNSLSPIPLGEFDRTPSAGGAIQNIASNAQSIPTTGGDVANNRAWFTSELTTGELISLWTDDTRDVIQIDKTTLAVTAYITQSALRALITTNFGIDVARIDSQNRLVIVYHTFASPSAIRVARILANKTLDLDQLVYTNVGPSPYLTINFWPISISPNGDKLAYARRNSGVPYDTVDFIEYTIASSAEAVLATKGGEYTAGADFGGGRGLATGYDINNDPLFGWEEQIVTPAGINFNHDFYLYINRYGAAADQWLINHWTGNPAVTGPNYDGSSQRILGWISPDKFGSTNIAWVWWHINFAPVIPANLYLASVNLVSDVLVSNEFNTTGPHNPDWVPVWIAGTNSLQGRGAAFVTLIGAT